MTGLLLSNLDASTTPYHTGAQDGMPWFAILNKDYSPRPAWKAFKAWREGDGAQANRRSRPATTAQQPLATSTTAQQLPPPPSSPAPELAAATPVPLPTGTPEPGPPPDSAILVPGPSPDATNPAPTSDSAAPTPAPSTPTSTPAPAPPTSASTPTRLKVGKTDGTGANLRERPSADAKAIAILLDGTTVELIGEDVKAGSLTWRNVRTVGSTSDGVTGWVAAQYLVP
jgi:hypothetical protein